MGLSRSDVVRAMMNSHKIIRGMELLLCFMKLANDILVKIITQEFLLIKNYISYVI